MKKLISLLIIAIIALTSSINANAWTDRNTFNLKGPVKAVIGSNNYDEYLNFYENGIIIYEEDPDLYWATIERDNKGRIIYMSRVNYDYNSKGQVKETSCMAAGYEQIKYTYNTKGLVIKEISFSKDFADSPKHTTTTTTYTYQKIDKYGNWTKRTAKNKYGKEVQTRTITYYE